MSQTNAHPPNLPSGFVVRITLKQEFCICIETLLTVIIMPTGARNAQIKPPSRLSQQLQNKKYEKWWKCLWIFANSRQRNWMCSLLFSYKKLKMKNKLWYCIVICKNCCFTRLKCITFGKWMDANVNPTYSVDVLYPSWYTLTEIATIRTGIPGITSHKSIICKKKKRIYKKKTI